jgi:hypothetical protein
MDKAAKHAIPAGIVLLGLMAVQTRSAPAPVVAGLTDRERAIAVYSALMVKHDGDGRHVVGAVLEHLPSAVDREEVRELALRARFLSQVAGPSTWRALVTRA